MKPLAKTHFRLMINNISHSANKLSRAQWRQSGDGDPSTGKSEKVDNKSRQYSELRYHLCLVSMTIQLQCLETEGQQKQSL